MSGDMTSTPPLIAMARPGEAASRSPFVQLKAIESLGRLKDAESVATLREILEAKKTFGWVHHRELRIAAAQALSKTDPRYSSQVLSDSGLEPAELAIAPSGYGSGLPVGAAASLRAHGPGENRDRQPSAVRGASRRFRSAN